MPYGILLLKILSGLSIRFALFGNVFSGKSVSQDLLPHQIILGINASPPNSNLHIYTEKLLYKRFNPSYNFIPGILKDLQRSFIIFLFRHNIICVKSRNCANTYFMICKNPGNLYVPNLCVSSKL